MAILRNLVVLERCLKGGVGPPINNLLVRVNEWAMISIDRTDVRTGNCRSHRSRTRAPADKCEEQRVRKQDDGAGDST